MGRKRSFSQEFKLDIIKELETKRLSAVCRENDIAPSTVSGWKKDYEKDPQGAFSGQGNLWKEDAKLSKYERLVGQLYAENAFLKKAYMKLKQHMAEEKRIER